jgi:hypothetical protein
MAQIVGMAAITHDHVVIGSVICNHILLHVLSLYSNKQSPEKPTTWQQQESPVSTRVRVCVFIVLSTGILTFGTRAKFSSSLWHLIRVPSSRISVMAPMMRRSSRRVRRHVTVVAPIAATRATGTLDHASSSASSSDRPRTSRGRC